MSQSRPQNPNDLETISRLHSAGAPVEVIARGLGIPATQVNAVIVNLGQPAETLDDELADKVRSLADEAVHQADLMLRYGPASQKLAIIKPFLNTLARHVATARTDDQEDIRQEFTRLLDDMKTVPELEPFVTTQATEFIPVDSPELQTATEFET